MPTEAATRRLIGTSVRSNPPSKPPLSEMLTLPPPVMTSGMFTWIPEGRIIGTPDRIDRRLDLEFVDGDDAEIDLHHQVGFDRQRVELGDPRLGDLQQVAEPVRQVEQRGIAEIERVALAGVEHELEGAASPRNPG